MKKVRRMVVLTAGVLLLLFAFILALLLIYNNEYMTELYNDAVRTAHEQGKLPLFHFYSRPFEFLYSRIGLHFGASGLFAALILRIVLGIPGAAVFALILGISYTREKMHQYTYAHRDHKFTIDKQDVNCTVRTVDR